MQPLRPTPLDFACRTFIFFFAGRGGNEGNGNWGEGGGGVGLSYRSKLFSNKKMLPCREYRFRAVGGSQISRCRMATNGYLQSYVLRQLGHRSGNLHPPCNVRIVRMLCPAHVAYGRLTDCRIHIKGPQAMMAPTEGSAGLQTVGLHKGGYRETGEI